MKKVSHEVILYRSKTKRRRTEETKAPGPSQEGIFSFINLISQIFLKWWTLLQTIKSKMNKCLP